MATVWCMDLYKRESLDMTRRFSSGFQPSLVIMVETLLVLLESLQTNLAGVAGVVLSVLYFWLIEFDARWFGSTSLNAEVVFLEIIEGGRLSHSFVVLGKNELHIHQFLCDLVGFGTG